MEVFSTAYLPAIAYIGQYRQSHHPVIDLGENYIKQTHRNRGLICSSNGVLPLIVPLRKSVPMVNRSRKTGDMEISYAENWQNQHIRSIRSCYKNSPYYEHYQEEFEYLINNRYTFLYELNGSVLKWLLGELDMDLKHQLSTDYIAEPGINDYRNFDYPKTATRPYKQVFSDRNGFCSGLSCIDLLFNKGPESLVYIE